MAQGNYSYKPGLGAVGAYQVSGTPYVTGNVDASSTTVQLDFPKVTQWVVISNPAGAALSASFSANGMKASESNFFELPASTVSPRLEVKATQLFLKGGHPGVSVMAGLTSIDSEYIDNSAVSPSGSNWSGSLGALVG
jgi:hypothetical protein